MKKLIIFVVSILVFFCRKCIHGRICCHWCVYRFVQRKKLPKVPVCNALEKRIVAKILKGDIVVGVAVVNPRRCSTAEVPQFGKKR